MSCFQYPSSRNSHLRWAEEYVFEGVSISSFLPDTTNQVSLVWCSRNNCVWNLAISTNSFHSGDPIRVAVCLARACTAGEASMTMWGSSRKPWYYGPAFTISPFNKMCYRMLPTLSSLRPPMDTHCPCPSKSCPKPYLRKHLESEIDCVKASISCPAGTYSV